MALPGLEIVWVPNARASVDLVLVHGLGRNLGTTWHHEEAGKTWVQDGDFLSQLTRPVRVLSFAYNSDVAANLSAASVAFHAHDLLLCLELVLANPPRPLIFVAHGCGGLIVKKAIQLCYSTPLFHPILKTVIAGVVFFGTPHAHQNSEALLQFVRGTAAVFSHEDSPASDDDMREFATVVSNINVDFSTKQPKHLQLLSFWEQKPTQVPSSEGTLDAVRVVPETCRAKLANNEDINVDCSHSSLSQFPTAIDEKFAAFTEKFVPFILDIIVRMPSLPPPMLPPPPPPPGQAPPQLVPGPPKPHPNPSPTPKVKDPEPGKVVEILKQPPLPPPPEGDMFRYWSRRKQNEEETTNRQGFIQSLKGWSEDNFGHNIEAAPGTCEWFKGNNVFRKWLAEPHCCTLFYVGEPGQGKTHLAKAISTHLKQLPTRDEVISFFCKPHEKSPAVWEYIIWNLIKNRPRWFLDVPAQYHGRDENSPPLSPSSLLDIWKVFLEANHSCTIFLIIDGLEQADASFAEFFAGVERLHRLRPNTSSTPDQPSRSFTKLKILFTSRISHDAGPASNSVSRAVIKSSDVHNDIGLYLDNRLARLQDKGTGSKIENLDDVKKLIQQESGFYWPFTRFAVEDIEQSASVMSSKALGFTGHAPAGVIKQYDDILLPIFQSVENESYLRTILVLIASTETLAFSISQLQGILSCLHGEEAVSKLDIEQTLMARCMDLFWVKDQRVLLFHSSLGKHLATYLTTEQRNTNMAYVCLKYLLQESFASKFPLSWTDRVGSQRRLDDEAPFYEYAARQWTDHLRNLTIITPELRQLLQIFLSDNCPQFRTLVHWGAWAHDKPEKLALYNESPAFSLLIGGCVNFFNQFVPVPGQQPLAPWNRLAELVPFTVPGLTRDESILQDDWFTQGNYNNISMLMAATLSYEPDMVEYILRWPVDINATSPLRRTALMELLLSNKEVKNPAHSDSVCRITYLLLKNGADPNICDEDGMTALHFASAWGTLKTVKILLDYGALMDVVDIWGCSPLECAFVSNRLDAVSELVHRGADVDQWWSSGVTPIFRCILQGNMDMFRIFLPFADVNQATVHDDFPIPLAAGELGSDEFLRLLLTRPCADLDNVDKRYLPNSKGDGANAVCLAVQAGRYQALEMLLQAGASPGPVPRLRMQSLTQAARQGRIAMAELLLAYGAPVNDFSDEYYFGTALTYAVDANNEEMVSFLLEHGADPTVEDGFDVLGPMFAALESNPPKFGIVRQLLTAAIPADVNFVAKGEVHALVNAIRLGNAEVVEFLLEQGADISLFLLPGQKVCPIHRAAVKGQVDICKILLRHEPKLLNLQFEQGSFFLTPLHAACETEHYEMIRFLLEQGARTDLLSHHYRESPLIAACIKGNLKTVKMIVEAAPELVNVAPYDGCSPLMIACHDGKLDVIKFLLEAGADVHHRDECGMGCISNGMFGNKATQPCKTIELLMQYGLDINAIDNIGGYTILGLAIANGTAQDVAWLLERGADPLRCLLEPLPGETWQNALQVAVFAKNLETLNLLLEEKRGLREHLASVDLYGQPLMPMHPSRGGAPVVARILAVCEEIARDTGRDFYTDIMQRCDISGLSCVDRALGRSDATPSARPHMDGFIISYLEHLLPLKRTWIDHNTLLEEIATLLLCRGGYDDAALHILEAIMHVPTIRWNDDGAYVGKMALPSCEGCRQGIFDEWVCCKICKRLRCSECRGLPAVDMLHEHVWLEGRDRGATVDSEEMQRLLERLHAELSPPTAEPLLESSSSIAEELIHTPSSSPSPAPSSAPSSNTTSPSSETPTATTGKHDPQPVQDQNIQGAFQLAILHAFNFLSVRRPLFTPYLPLPPSTESLIAPWKYLIRYERRFVERDVLEYEFSRQRRISEMRYLNRGLGRPYVDAELVRLDEVVESVGRLFVEHDQVSESSARRVKGAGLGFSLEYRDSVKW